MVANALCQEPGQYRSERWAEIEKLMAPELMKLLGYDRVDVCLLHDQVIALQYAQERMTGVEQIARALTAHYQAALCVLERFYPIDRIGAEIAAVAARDDGAQRHVDTKVLCDPAWITAVIERDQAALAALEAEEAGATTDALPSAQEVPDGPAHG